jgi:hypothetical protein
LAASAGSGASGQADAQAQIKAGLGEERYAEYQKAQDPDYRQLSIAAARYNLPRDTATEVFEIKRAIQSERDRVQTLETLTPEQRDAALQAMANETEQAVKAVLGEKAFKFYRRTGHGAWMSN